MERETTWADGLRGAASALLVVALVYAAGYVTARATHRLFRRAYFYNIRYTSGALHPDARWHTEISTPPRYAQMQWLERAFAPAIALEVVVRDRFTPPPP